MRYVKVFQVRPTDEFLDQVAVSLEKEGSLPQNSSSQSKRQAARQFLKSRYPRMFREDGEL